MYKKLHLTAYTDGASKGNPGQSAIGFTIEKDGVTLEEHCHYIGLATNNVAEYTALIYALEHMKSLGATDTTIYSDSELLVNQINGLYRVKNERLRQLYNKVLLMKESFDSFKVVHVYRYENSRADSLAKRAIREHNHKKTGTMSR